jgi:hypothetical protein
MHGAGGQQQGSAEREGTVQLLSKSQHPITPVADLLNPFCCRCAQMLLRPRKADCQCRVHCVQMAAKLHAQVAARQRTAVCQWCGVEPPGGGGGEEPPGGRQTPCMARGGNSRAAQNPRGTSIY